MFTSVTSSNRHFPACLSAQEAALHQELHPHEPFCVVHLESYFSLHQGRRAVRPGGQRALLHSHCECHKRACTHVLAPLMWTDSELCLVVSLLSLKLECRAVMIFFHYCVLSNYFWLFIEGLYLFTLLVETFFPEKRYFYWYIIIGWGETSTTSHTLHFSSDQTLLLMSRFFVFLWFLHQQEPPPCAWPSGRCWGYTLIISGRLGTTELGLMMKHLWSGAECFFCLQVLGHEWQRCHLVGDQGTCAGLNYGTMSLSNDDNPFITSSGGRT